MRPGRSPPPACTKGVFREDMFDEAEGLDHPYFMTKHESEKIVRKECKVPWTVYRPAMVVGDSKTGEMDKIDGPYYFFKLIQKHAQDAAAVDADASGIEGGRINIVPVDFVVDAIDHIATRQGLDGQVLPPGGPDADARRRRAHIFARPRTRRKMTCASTRAARLHPAACARADGAGPGAAVRRQRGDEGPGPARGHVHLHQLPDPLRLPRDRARAQGQRHRMPRCTTTPGGCGTTGSATSTPTCSSTAACKGKVGGKVVLITGGSSGIGLAAALQVCRGRRHHDHLRARRGQAVRRPAKRSTKPGRGKQCFSYTATSPTWPDCDRFVRCWPNTAASTS
jgi:hypothetical protein